MSTWAQLAAAAVVTAALAACGDPDIVVPEALWVEIAPGHGATEVDLDVEVLAFFWEPVAQAETAAAAISLDCLGAPPCRDADASGCPASTLFGVAFEPGNQIAHLTPAASLAAGTCYQVRVAEGVAAAAPEVGPLPVEVRSTFQTRP